MQNEILNVINNFKSQNKSELETKYLCGDCYVFARALVSRFGGEIAYLAIDNHFIAYIEDEYYDIRGLVPKDELWECYLWEDYKQFDPLDADRVQFYCIDNKEVLTL